MGNMLRQGHLSFEGESQAAITVLDKCGGNADNFPIVKELPVSGGIYVDGRKWGREA